MVIRMIEKPVEIKKAFKLEVKNFNPWLAKEENMKLLGKKIGKNIDTKLVELEKKLDCGQADIVTENKKTKKPIIIECHLGKSDFNHLDRLIKYGQEMKAETLIYVAPKITNEIKEYLDYLKPCLELFLIQVETYKMGNDYAVELNVALEPNTLKMEESL